MPIPTKKLNSYWLKIAACFAALFGIGMLATFQAPPVWSVQHGYRGTGMQQIFHPETVRRLVVLNKVPDPEPTIDPAGTPSSAAYQNVKVLRTVDSNEFLRLMTAITNWVSPTVAGQEDTTGCAYCHNVNNMAEDSKYTKIVARRMLQMVQHINSQWQSHVQGVGVTCYTCHRGMPVPANVWFADPGRTHFNGMVQAYSSMGLANPTVGYSALPSDVFTPFLQQDNSIRVESTTALPGTDNSSIKQTEWTYGLMIHFASALGVNCTYCHNSRQFASWEQSAPQRVTAWYGIRMVRDVNNDYLGSLHGVFPPYRLGPTGDVAEVNCTTCHQGVFKPLYGVSMLKDYQELGAPTDGGKTSQLDPSGGIAASFAAVQ